MLLSGRKYIEIITYASLILTIIEKFVISSISKIANPRTPENFRKFAKKFRKKIAKMQYFLLFCKKISKPCVKFSRVWTKNTIGWGNFETILKGLMKIQ